MGFWSNNNGRRLITNADLTALRGFCLRNANGSNFDPTTIAQFQSWIISTNANNMANMLSSQMAATYLSIVHGFTNPSVLVDGVRNGNDLVAYANSLLCANGNTPSGNPARAEQTRVKDICDRINNGLSFAQAGACPVVYTAGSVQHHAEIGNEQAETAKPSAFALRGNYPNPFNPTTMISYELPENVFVSLKVYDVLGREVASLINDVQAAGSYDVRFDASNLPSGMYFYRLQAGSFSASKKLMLVK